MRKFDNWTFEELHEKLTDEKFFSRLTEVEEINFSDAYFSKLSDDNIHESAELNDDYHDHWNIQPEFVKAEEEYYKKIGGTN